MKSPLVVVVIILAILFGLFLLIPRGNNQSETSQKGDASKMTQDPTVYEKVSASNATINTEKGDIEIELYSNDAPKTVINFATLAANNYYDNLTFHRVEPGFVIQGGDPNGNGTGGTSVYGETFEDELDSETNSYQAGYKKGVVAMANRGPNTNSSQFFIMLEDNDMLPKNYTIFGKVTQGMDVVEQIRPGDRISTISIQ